MYFVLHWAMPFLKDLFCKVNSLMGSSSPGVRAAAILILLFIKTVDNRADSECQEEWLEKGIARRDFSPLCLWKCILLSPSFSAPPITVTLSVCVCVCSLYSILHAWVILNKINKNHDNLTNTAVTKLRCIRDAVCLWGMLCRPAMDFSDKLISNSIKWTACCRTGIIYSRLKLIKILLQKLPLSLFMARMFRYFLFVTHFWELPKGYRQCMDYCMVHVSNSALKAG